MYLILSSSAKIQMKQSQGQKTRPIQLFQKNSLPSLPIERKQPILFFVEIQHSMKLQSYLKKILEQVNHHQDSFISLDKHPSRDHHLRVDTAFRSQFSRLRPRLRNAPMKPFQKHPSKQELFKIRFCCQELTHCIVLMLCKYTVTLSVSPGVTSN